MNAAMMANALIIVHLWSLVVASGAWALQRDGHGRIGAHFPAPNIWLLLIFLCLSPGALYLIPFGKVISLPTTEAFEIFSIQADEFPTDGTRPLNLLATYAGLGVFLMARTLWRWSQLQRLPSAPTADRDIFTTAAALPPLTLSWPRRAVLVPQGVETQATLIRHERAHLHHNDAEFTLLLLLLKDLMLRNPGVSYLVRQWRLSIELRADRAATKGLSALERKDYAAFLLNFQRPIARHTETLPCPTARLNSTPHRNAKMRLMGIMEDAPGVRERRWGAAILFTSISASGLGITSALATAGPGVINMASSPIDYVRQTPLQMPASCPGLIGDIKRRGAEFEEKEMIVNGQLVSRYAINLGTVVLGHDVRRNGSINNLRVLASTHSCFEAEAKAAIAQWMTEPRDFEIKDAAVKVHFTMSADTSEELNSQLVDFLQ